jgi:co-chaperonin GroES (HSP10)
MTFTPRAATIHIKISRPAERSAGGLWLPQIRETRTTEGKVISTGPGRLLPGFEERIIVWLMVGDTILFSEENLQALGKSGEGLIAEDHVLATVDPVTNVIYPEGEWVLLDPDPAPAVSRLGIHLADRARPLPRSGVIMDLGPGDLRVHGPLAGVRAAPRHLWSLEPDEPLLGRRAFWSKEATIHWAARQVLVRARDLICLEGDE